MLYCINRSTREGKEISSADRVGELMAIEMVINGMKAGDTVVVAPFIVKAYVQSIPETKPSIPENVV